MDDSLDVLASAERESFNFLEWIHRQSIGFESTDTMMAELLWITEKYLTVPIMPLFERTPLIRRLAFGSLRDKPGPRRRRELFVVAGWSMTILGWMATDLGDVKSAGEHLRAAWACSQFADDDHLKSWIRATQHTTSFWQERYSDAAAYAEDGLRWAGDGTARLFLNSAHALDLAKMGNVEEAERALRAARESAHHVNTDGELAGPFTCSFSRAAGGLWSDASLALGLPRQALQYIDDANGDNLNAGSTRMIGAQKAKSHLILGEHEKTWENLAPILSTDLDLRARPLVARIDQIRRLAQATNQDCPIRKEIHQATRDFVRASQVHVFPEGFDR
jgi:tetratricopeptide (TPR) repeat protein